MCSSIAWEKPFLIILYWQEECVSNRLSLWCNRFRFGGLGGYLTSFACWPSYSFDPENVTNLLWVSSFESIKVEDDSSELGQWKHGKKSYKRLAYFLPNSCLVESEGSPYESLWACSECTRKTCGPQLCSKFSRWKKAAFDGWVMDISLQRLST